MSYALLFCIGISLHIKTGSQDFDKTVALKNQVLPAAFVQFRNTVWTPFFEMEQKEPSIHRSIWRTLIFLLIRKNAQMRLIPIREVL